MPLYVDVAGLQAALSNAGGAGARTAASLPADRLTVHLKSAEAEVLARLSAFSITPPESTDPVPPGLLLDIIVGIAGYLATLEFFGSLPLEDRDPVVLRYQRAQALLAQLAAGRLVVAGVDDPAHVVESSAAIFQGGPAVDLADQALPSAYPGYYPGGAYGGGQTWA